MALQPKSLETQMRLQPGARGEQFVADMPGYRNGETRINRTQNRLNVASHDALSQKYILDNRLRPLFRYGYAAGYNHLVTTKGRIVAADPYMDKAENTNLNGKMFNTLTLANGGAPVKIRETSDVYPTTSVVSGAMQGQQVHEQGLEWAPVSGFTDTWGDGYYRSQKTSGTAQLTAGGYSVDAVTGLISDGTALTLDVRAGNVPLGMLERNEYTRFDDAHNGMQPGPIITDAVVELPYFAFKDKAEQNPWGCIYGNLKVGDLVKSDENGRVTVSPLSNDTILDTLGAVEIERERQQVIGQVIGFNHDMVPEGGYRWAQWALEDRLRYEGLTPDYRSANNRPGEDNINASVYQTTGRYPGYPYDTNYSEHDLHMLASGTGRADNYGKFMQAEYQLENGIPGLTDGYNAVIKDYENNSAAVINARPNTDQPFVQNIVWVCQNGNFEEGSLEVQLDDGSGTAAWVTVDVTDNVALNPKAIGTTGFAVTYYNAVQGIIRINAVDETTADATLAAATDEKLIVNLKYKKRGEAGVPTFMDWDGCVGSAKILLQR